ncbi:uncharacterized protein LOC101856198 [Aplysia californica]|uniref:Uncharacterized protein LOC101856198 n=1 Tax=Aplysia californica TaxID=6500 RepID=A0ABM0JW17_APLCA|nr:uncharacterized protein LOC101856198 [Aplysia californica]
MGNCLDVKPPPQKHPHGHRHVNGSAPRYMVGSYPPSIASDRHMVPMGESAMYQPHMTPYGMMPASPAVAIDPVTGQQFSIPVHLVQHPQYMDGMFYGGHYDGYHWDGSEEQDRRSRHSKQKRRKGSEDEVDVNANRNSTVIQTFPDPAQDVVFGHKKPIPSSARPTTHATNSTTVTHAQVVGSSTAHTSTQPPQTEPELTVNQVPVSQIQPVVTSVPGRGSTYVTYLPEPEPEPEPEVVSEPEVTVEEESIVHEEQVMMLEVDGGETAGMMAEQLLIDEHFDLTAFTQPKTTFTKPKTTSTYMSSKSRGMRVISAMNDAHRADVVISYSACDVDTMWKLKGYFERNGVNVWASNPHSHRTEEDSVMNGQVIIDAKILVVVLSKEGVLSPALRDEVCLACVSDTLIYPITVDQSLAVLDSMSLSLKLQLFIYKWDELTNEEHPAEIVLDVFVRAVAEELEIMKTNPDIIDEDFGMVSSWAEKRHNALLSRRLLRTIPISNIVVSGSEFWTRHFPDEERVEWIRFRKAFVQEFSSHMNSSIPRAGHVHVLESLRREIGVDDQNFLTRVDFIMFSTEEETYLDLWEKTLSLARENLALRDVFDVESSVRTVAIENIGKFGSPSVMAALRDLLEDPDANVRAVATVSLSRCMVPGDEVTYSALLKSLDDKDRLVREAGCLAMGHLKDSRVVQKLIEMWRNDVISHVREAASAALTEIGGAEAQEAMRVTRILSDEIQTLSP